MELSIVIITRNRHPELMRAIQSVWSQHLPDSELIIIDNASTDDTEQIIKKLQDNHQIPIKYKKLQENMGVSGARNIGYQLSEGKFVYFLDDDAVIPEKNLINSLYRFLKSNPSVGAVTTQIYNTKLEGYETPRLSGNDYAGFPVILSYIGCSHAIRSSLFGKDENLYPESLFYGHEEFFACLRIHDFGYKVVYLNDLEVIHNPSIKTRRNHQKVVYNNIINKGYIKLLLFPVLLIPAVYFFLGVRFFIHFRLDLNQWIRGINVLRKHLEGERYNRIRYRTVFQLITTYGLSIL